MAETGYLTRIFRSWDVPGGRDLLGITTSTHYASTQSAVTVTLIAALLEQAMSPLPGRLLWQRMSIRDPGLIPHATGTDRLRLAMSQSQLWHRAAQAWARRYFEHLVVAFCRKTPRFPCSAPARRDSAIARRNLIDRDGGRCAGTNRWCSIVPSRWRQPSGAGCVLAEAAHIIPHCVSNNDQFTVVAEEYAGIAPWMIRGDAINHPRNLMLLERDLHALLDRQHWGIEHVRANQYGMRHVTVPPDFLVLRGLPESTAFHFGRGNNPAGWPNPEPRFVNLSLAVSRICRLANVTT